VLLLGLCRHASVCAKKSSGRLESSQVADDQARDKTCALPFPLVLTELPPLPAGDNTTTTVWDENGQALTSAYAYDQSQAWDPSTGYYADQSAYYGDQTAIYADQSTTWDASGYGEQSQAWDGSAEAQVQAYEEPPPPRPSLEEMTESMMTGEVVSCCVCI
jgi:hypothetical protein